MTNQVDWRNTPLAIGAQVLYPVSYAAHSVGVVIGELLEIIEVPQPKWRNTKVYQARVRRLSINADSVGPCKDGRVVLVSLGKLTVIHK